MDYKPSLKGAWLRHVIHFTTQHYASAVYAIVVSPSVCLTHCGIISKWLNLRLRK